MENKHFISLKIQVEKLKTMGSLLLAGMILLFGCSIGNAQIIYSNAFNGAAVNIDGTAPNMANDFAGGTSSATWHDALGVNDTNAVYANGDVGTGQPDSWTLPFTPKPGYVYTLTASLTFSGNPGNWVGLGFAQRHSHNVPVGYGRFSDSSNGGPNGYDWIILTEANGNVQYFAGPNNGTQLISQNGFFTPGPGTHTVKVILDTTGTQWAMASYLDGVQVATDYTYETNPTIGAVGITQTTLTTPGAVQWNYFLLQTDEAGPNTNTVNATVSFSPANIGLPLNPAFGGLSYEKKWMANIGYFSPTNTGLINLFNLLGTGVVRIGAGQVDIYNWGGISNCPPITANEVDQLAGFIKAVPQWKVIYGLNFASNNAANCSAEAQYAANALGSQLLGFEIGNEPDEYGVGSNTLRPPGFTYSDYIAQWNPLKLAAEQYGPLIGPATASFTEGHWQWTTNFAHDESGIILMATQHYYRGNAKAYTNGSPIAMQLLMTPDTALPGKISTLVSAVNAANLPLGLRMDESASMVNGGLAGVSDAYGAALWTLDYMFTLALNGAQGVNLHGGGRSPYTPLYDNNTGKVLQVRPEFYGLKMFSLLPHGNVVPANLTLDWNVNFTAYGVRTAGGGISALLNNKETSNSVTVSVNLGPNVSGAQLIKLTGPSLFSTNGYMLGGATINPDGSWSGGVQAVLPATNGQLTVSVPPISAFLLNPVLAPSEIAVSVSSSQLTLNWPINYIGWLLESNSTGLAGTNWFPVPGSGNTNRVQITIPPGQNNVFYRLSLP